MDSTQPIESLGRGGHWRNWVGNQSFIAQHMAEPADEAQLCELVAEAGRREIGVRCAGSGHSFTPVVATNGLLLSASKLTGIRDIEMSAKRVKVKAGTRIGDVGRALKQAGLSLTNQGDIDTQALAGALCTGTHGTGITLGNMASQIVGMRLVQPSGEVLEVSDTGDIEMLRATQVSVGVMGVISEITLQATDSYNLHERLWRDDFDTMLEKHDELAATHRHFGFFWCPVPESRHLYCLPDTSAVSSTTKTSDVCEMKVMDYAVPLVHAKEALCAVRELMLTQHPDCIYPIEYRFTAGDPGWISPFYEQDSITLSVSGGPGIDYWAYLRDVDAILRRFGSRPHWGKMHFLNRDDVDALYPKAEDFRTLRRRLDPAGMFLNDHLRLLFG
jgi:FAD/FMN-containing dehydrogenase